MCLTDGNGGQTVEVWLPNRAERKAVEVEEMAQLTPTLYVSKVVPMAEGCWRGLKLRETVATAEGTLHTSGLPIGVAVSPFEPSRSVPARLDVGRGRLATAVEVEIELQPWSKDRVELGLRPRRRLPLLVSERRYLDAARSVVDELAAELELQGIVLAPSGPLSVG